MTAEDIAVTVGDDETVSTGVTLTVDPATLAEGDGGTTVTVTGTLNGGTRTAATAVTVSVGASDDSAVEGTDYATVEALTLTIGAGQTAATQTFLLIPTDDDVDEAQEALTVAGSATGLDVTAAAVLIEDNDERGVTLDVTALPVPEGGRATYTVVLASEPTGTVTVTPAVTGSPTVTVSGALTFTASDWNQAQTVTVSAQDDADAVNDTATVAHTVSGADYGTVTAEDIAVTVGDDETVSTGVVLSVAPASVSEDAGATVVTVTGTLDHAPRLADTVVTVTVGAVDDTAVEGTDYGTVGSLTLTIAAGSASGTQDFHADAGGRRCGRGGRGADGCAGSATGLAVTAAAVLIEDNDERGVTLDVTALPVPEGGRATYTVVLASEPTGTVTVTPAVSGNSPTVTVSGALTFTASDWDQAQTVTVSAAPDADADEETATIEHAVSGADYGSVEAGAVAVTVGDNETATTTVTLSVNPRAVAEDGNAATVTVTGTLNNAPRTTATSVTVTVGAAGDTAVEGTDYATVTGVTLTIAEGQTTGTASFTLTPTADDIDDDGETLTVAGTTAVPGLSVIATAVTINDDERGVTVSKTTLPVAEGGSETYTVVLTSEPTGAVTVTPSVTGSPAVTVSGALTFTASDWDQAQTVTVSAAPDADADEETATIEHAVSGADYGAVEAGAVAVTVSEQIWATTLTVEARDGFRGYSLVANPDAGSVSNRLFDYGSAYEVLILVAYSDGVVFRVRNRGENLSELVLEWAGTTLPLNAATRAGNQYTWSPAWLDAHAASLNASSYASTLPENGTGTVCLRTSEQTCPATTITGGSAVVPTASQQQIWTTTLTVEARDGFRGYSLVANPDAGSVSNRLFDYGSAYEVLILVAYSDGVVFRVRNRGENLSELVLEWAGTTLPLNAATRAGNQYTWSPAWLDAHAASLNASSYASTLPENGTGTVCLRTSEQTCPATTITGGSAVVPAASQQQSTVPLTAVLSNVPAEHDGETAFWLELSFDAAVVEGSKPRIRALLGVTGGSETKVRRKDGRLDRWRIRIEPSSHEAVTVRLSPSPACGATGAVCTEDGRTYTTALATTIHGPVGISVADTTVTEGADAQLDFVVSLSRAAVSPVTVDYLTRDGTAIAGQDYTATSGTVTFAAGETGKTVTVPVLDDVHDEGSETMKLKLANASGGRLTDRKAIGTITNSDPLQRAWLSRFGRSVGTHVTDAVGDRLRDTQGQSYMTIAGQNIPLGKDSQASSKDMQASSKDTLVQSFTNLDAGVVGDPYAGGTQKMNLREILQGSSFRLNMGADGGRGSHLTAWGRFAGTAFSGRDGDLSLDGDVFTGTVGIDGTWGRVLAGLAVAHSRGDGTYSGVGERGQGALENTLTSLHPYLQYALTDRLNVWGMVGYGWGALDLTLETGKTMETDTRLLMGTVGGRGILLSAHETGGFELATRSDVMFTNTESDAVAGVDGKLVASEGEAHRLRVVLEGSRAMAFAEGRSLTPTLELGLRHDWGDAETGFGLELGGRVQYADPTLGLTIEGAVRGLLAHEDSDYQEWGASGSLRIAPGAGGQGLSLTLAPTWGAASSGMDGLWSRQTTAGLAPQGARPSPTAQLNAEIGYGLAGPFGPGLLTPYAGTVLSDGAARTYRLGTRWTAVSGLTLSLDGQRQEPAGQQPVNQGLQLQVGWGF